MIGAPTVRSVSIGLHVLGRNLAVVQERAGGESNDRKRRVQRRVGFGRNARVELAAAADAGAVRRYLHVEGHSSPVERIKHSYVCQLRWRKEIGLDVPGHKKQTNPTSTTTQSAFFPKAHKNSYSAKSDCAMAAASEAQS